MPVSLNDMVLHHACRNDFADQMARFYADVDRAIDDHGPTCWNRGACCKFDRFGHKLYVTSAELAYFVWGHAEEWRIPADDAACPYQIEGRCTAREHRPLGCRIFFCDPEAQHWQNDEYERRLKELKALSEAHGLEYRYGEWLSALKAMHIVPATEMPNRPTPGIDRLPLPVIE